MQCTLNEYLEAEILPLYDCFDLAHGRDHALKVLHESLALAEHYPVEVDMVRCVAVYHDVGLCEGRERHHLVSGRMLRGDAALRSWFSEGQIEVMAQAVEDHRASSAGEPRSIYGRIVAEADRDIEPRRIVERTVLFGLSHYPELDLEGHWRRALGHLREKYAEGGYLRLYIPESRNAERLAELRRLIGDPARLRLIFDEIMKTARNSHP